MDNILNPILQKMLGSILRAALTLAVPFLVSSGVWVSEDEAMTRVAAISVALAALLLSFYEKYSSQKKLVTALTMPAGSTQVEVEKKVATEPTPPVTLPKTEAPK